jgi:hypothetical protein
MWGGSKVGRLRDKRRVNRTKSDVFVRFEAGERVRTAVMEEEVIVIVIVIVHWLRLVTRREVVNCGSNKRDGEWRLGDKCVNIPFY